MSSTMPHLTECQLATDILLDAFITQLSLRAMTISILRLPLLSSPTQSPNVRWTSGMSPFHPSAACFFRQSSHSIPHATSMNTSPFPNPVDFCGFYLMCIRRSTRRSSKVTCAYGPEHLTPFLTRSVMTLCSTTTQRTTSSPSIFNLPSLFFVSGTMAMRRASRR